MKLSEFIRNYREEHGLSVRAFAQKAGISAAYISMLEREKDSRTGKPNVPSILTVRMIARATGRTLDQLMREIDPDTVVGLGVDTVPENLEDLPEMTRIPVIGRIACGSPIYAAENLEGYADAPKNVRADFALICRGDSMTGAGIRSGDLVYIRQQPEVEEGQIAAVVIGEEATLKRVYTRQDRLLLVSENPAYPPMVIEGEELEETRILGLAVAYQHSLI